MNKTLATIGAAAMLSLGGVSVAATPAHADPIDCSANTSGSPGNTSFTLHINANPCGYPIRAWGDCTTEEFFFGVGWTTTGGSTTAYSGESVASCSGAFIENYYYGYDMYINGGWHRYNMYFGTWDS